MSKLENVFDEIDNSLAKTDAGFAGWNDEKSRPFKAKVDEYKKITNNLKSMAKITDVALDKLEGFQQNIDSFCRKVDSLCR